MRIRESEFGSHVKKFKNVLYLCHRNADPDAIGSAFALQQAFGGTVGVVDDLSRTGEALAASIGALAGCAVSPITQTQYDMGTSLAVKGFTCAVLGGLGSSTAAVAAGLLVGVLEAASISILPVAFKDVVALTILLAILFFRPQGLFGRGRPAAARS